MSETERVCECGHRHRVAAQTVLTCVLRCGCLRFKLAMSDVCGKGTFNGAAAQAARYQFAPCIRPLDHGGPCDSGPADDEPEAA